MRDDKDEAQLNVIVTDGSGNEGIWWDHSCGAVPRQGETIVLRDASGKITKTGTVLDVRWWFMDGKAGTVAQVFVTETDIGL